MKLLPMVLCLALTLAFATAPDARAAAKGQGKLAPLPPTVQQTIRALVGDGRLDEVTRTNENGQVVYEVDMRRDGVERSFTVTPAGRVIARQLFLPELPAAVQQTIRAHVGTAKLLEVWWTEDDGEISYEAELERGPLKHSFSVAPDGRLTSFQVELADTPAAVRKAIESRTAGARLESVHRSDEDDEPLYAVEALKAGRKITFTVGLGGALLSEGVELVDTPAPVQRTIKAEAGNGRIADLDRFTDEGETFFEVTVSRGGRKHVFIVAVDGEVVSVRVALADVPEAARKAITTRLAGAVLGHIDKTTADGATVFEVGVRKDGKRFVFTVGADGKGLP